MFRLVQDLTYSDSDDDTPRYCLMFRGEKSRKRKHRRSSPVVKRRIINPTMVDDRPAAPLPPLEAADPISPISPYSGSIRAHAVIPENDDEYYYVDEEEEEEEEEKEEEQEEEEDYRSDVESNRCFIRHLYMGLPLIYKDGRLTNGVLPRGLSFDNVVAHSRRNRD